MSNPKIDKEKKIFIILVFVLLFLLVIIGVTIGVSTIAKNNKREFVKKETYSEKMTITCTFEEEKLNLKKTEEIYLEKGVLITRTDKNEWRSTSPNEDTCKYYQTQMAGLNRYTGVSSNANCNETSGTSITTYTINEINRKDLKINQFDYLNEENILDYKSWISYMEKKDYTCVIGE